MISFRIALKREKIARLKNTDFEFSRTLCCLAKFRAFVLRPHRYYLFLNFRFYFLIYFRFWK